MKKKIVIDLPLNTENCRSKAMQIAVRCAGVMSVNVDKEKGHLVVIGVGVDYFRLMNCIRKKFRCSSIVSLEDVKPEKPASPKNTSYPSPKCPLICPPICGQYYPVCQPVYDPYNPTCTIM
ncbi:heavy metal-associated isoprenylated plant protein 47-like [Nicotiana tabacum]|uniref:Heavy metal-associated isoprenylated plant protein 47-like n=1 Tax=Nicotiana tabacum TaxID=4097 RepID=A0A1S4B439_TOBAC|nr:heavy metal-associated isoprenylated plant protein 47-like [Nicotiana tomentosiformis]XP_016483692.1 PREDICTED: uncharacterized protein LOC107804332 [Nicotiana tabacum]